jgi:PKD repeat protein
MRSYFRRAFAFAAVALAMLVIPATAGATPPPNDDFANATVVASFPFADVVNVADATTEPTEPFPCGISRTIWYTFTASTSGTIKADPAGSDFFDTSLIAYHVNSGGGLDALGCRFFGDPLFFDVQAGGTYYVQAGNLFTSGGNLHLALQVVPPPPNDNFADASLVTSFPFSDTVDTTAATTEPGEPLTFCESLSLDRTAWYAFTPSTSESVTATASQPFVTVVAAYKGSSLTNLTRVACHGNGVTLHVNAGTTYYFQVGGDSGVVRTGIPIQFSLQSAPPPVANFGFTPSDPSIFEMVQFFDASFDPAGAGFASEVWDFGDGTTATNPGCCPTHRYAIDGDYTVQLTATTFDGRTDSTSQVVHVRTHDVAITKFNVPQAASVGQTRPIAVGLANHRYAETVQVQLFKSVADGSFTSVGTLTQSVPVRPGNRTTDFQFTYSFTSDDAALGKVTFQAVATIVNARDALPADNTATALPTKVNG